MLSTLVPLQPLQGHRLQLRQPTNTHTPISTRPCISSHQRRAARDEPRDNSALPPRGRSGPASPPQPHSSRLNSDMPGATTSSSPSVTPLPGSHPTFKYAQVCRGLCVAAVHAYIPQHCTQHQQQAHAWCVLPTCFYAQTNCLLATRVVCILQMGHGSFGRGAPHVCYMHDSSSGQGLFYSRALQHEHQHKQPAALAWRQLAAHITHTTASLLHGSSGSGRSRSSSSLLAAASVGAAAAGGGGGVPALSAPADSCTTTASANAQQGSTGNPHDGSSSPRWHVLVVQALMLAVLLLVGGSVLKHLLRGGVAALVACYSGLPFKA